MIRKKHLLNRICELEREVKKLRCPHKATEIMTSYEGSYRPYHREVCSNCGEIINAYLSEGKWHEIIYKRAMSTAKEHKKYLPKSGKKGGRP